ncbi:uncharacterized protein LOC120628971 [Pararge aegeria]|uniref:uncharacterized protein LOC120628971 n=1 Tax=Pararge aegeria TaxID=116150 RepID=UPI0019D21AD4|nr:uncharacterized protein LOC120628971 [Pararge aegeria]
MCCCRKFTYCIGNMLYICERLVSCCAATSVVTCIVTTLLIMLALGIGLGYNYCYVDMETGRYKEDTLFATLKPIDIHATTSKSDLIVIHPTPEGTTQLSVDIAPTMVVSLFGGVDFSVLIQKLKKKRQNCTLHLIV